MPKDVWALHCRLIGLCECLVRWGGVLWHSTEQLALVWVHNSWDHELVSHHWGTKRLFHINSVTLYDFFFCWMSKFVVFWFFTLTLGKVMDLSDMTRNTCHSGTRAPQGFVHTWNWTLGPTVSGPPPRECQKVPKSEEIWGNTWKLNNSPSTLHRVTLYRYLSWDTETRVSRLKNGQHRLKSFKRRQIGSASPERGSSRIKITFSQRRPSTLSVHIGCCGAAAQAART